MEAKVYTCDGGCGQQLALSSFVPLDNIGNYGWFHVLAPKGYGTWQTCSLPCLIRVAEDNGARGYREIRR